MYIVQYIALEECNLPFLDEFVPEEPLSANISLKLEQAVSEFSRIASMGSIYSSQSVKIFPVHWLSKLVWYSDWPNP